MCDVRNHNSAFRYNAQQEYLRSVLIWSVCSALLAQTPENIWVWFCYCFGQENITQISQIIAIDVFLRRVISLEFPLYVVISAIKSKSWKQSSFILYRHGDMLYLVPQQSAQDNSGSSASASASAAGSSSSSSMSSQASSPKVVEDDVDVFLTKQDGMIHRKRDEQL